MTDLAPLDNPIWFALTTIHWPLARSNGLARRYPANISPFAALQEPTPAAFSDLRTLVGAEEKVALFTAEPLDVPRDWQVEFTRPLEQMIYTEPPPLHPIPLLTLQPADVPEMLALTAATEPGPFLPETIRMGNYFGMRSPDGRLIAMAGQRLKLNSFTEISAVCTDPEFRGRGHARALLVYLAAHTLAEGKVPFLHVKSENAAKFLYEKVGFRVRRAIQLTVIAPL